MLLKTSIELGHFIKMREKCTNFCHTGMRNP